MNNRRINIAILEPSDIVYEGLAQVLPKVKYPINLFRIESLSEIYKMKGVKQFNLLIVNPSQVQNKVNDFIEIKNNNHDLKIVGLVYCYFDRELLAMFEKLVYITDTSEELANMIDELSEPYNLAKSEKEPVPLSERETEILKLIINGLTNKEIADRLFISIHTVISHRKNISKKTGIKSLSGLTIYALVKKIIQLQEFES